MEGPHSRLRLVSDSGPETPVSACPWPVPKAVTAQGKLKGNRGERAVCCYRFLPIPPPNSKAPCGPTFVNPSLGTKGSAYTQGLWGTNGNPKCFVHTCRKSTDSPVTMESASTAKRLVTSCLSGWHDARTWLQQGSDVGETFPTAAPNGPCFYSTDFSSYRNRVCLHPVTSRTSLPAPPNDAPEHAGELQSLRTSLGLAWQFLFRSGSTCSTTRVVQGSRQRALRGTDTSSASTPSSA